MSDLSGLRGKNRRAPKTLLPRVMAAVAAEQARPWYRREWWSWPVAARAAYGLAVAAAALLIAKAGAQAAAPARAALAQAQAALGAGWVVAAAFWRLGGEPLRLVTTAMAVSCAAFATGLAGLLQPARRTI